MRQYFVNQSNELKKELARGWIGEGVFFQLKFEGARVTFDS